MSMIERQQNIVVDDPSEGAAELTVAAVAGGATLGIATAVFDATKAHLQAVLVQPEFRGRGVAKGLIAGIEAESRLRGMTLIHTTLETDRPNAAIVLHLLERLTWKEPLSGMVLCKGSPANVLSAPWCSDPLPADAEIFQWSDLTDAEKIRFSSDDPHDAWYPMALGPLPDAPVEPRVSVGIRKNGEIVGWMLIHRTGPDSVQYSRLFIRDDERRSNLATLLLAEAIRRQARAGIDIGEFAVRTDNTPMLGFLEQRLARFLFERKEVRYLEKPL